MFEKATSINRIGTRLPDGLKNILRRKPARPEPRIYHILKESTEYKHIGEAAPVIAEVYNTAKQIPGWFTVDDCLHFSMLLEYQKHLGIEGDILEIGSYFGRSTAVMAAFLQEGERIVICDAFERDIEDSYPETPTPTILERNIRAVSPGVSHDQIVIHACYSSDLEFAPSQTFRFIHIDGGHSAERAFGDMKICLPHLAPNGIMVLDDYHNRLWPEVTSGVDAFLNQEPSLVPIADMNRHGGDGRKLYLAKRAG